MKNEYFRTYQSTDKTNDDIFLIVCLVVSIFIGSFFGETIGFTLFLIIFFGGSLYLENKKFKQLLQTDSNLSLTKKTKKEKVKNRFIFAILAIGAFLYLF